MASATGDSFSQFDDVLAAAPAGSPWHHAPGRVPQYRPDYQLLGRLLSIPVAAGARSETGNFANGIDAWISAELRRAGFGADTVWPRPSRPRVLPQDIAALIARLPAAMRPDMLDRVARMPAVAPVDAKVLGRAYEKQVDVVVARWDRGPELLISTKAQLSSFGKNLANRFEESYGDAGNLRGRYPLAAVGYFFVQRATIKTREPAAFERSIDMIRKLRDSGDGDGYTATALLLVDWNDDNGTVRAQEQDVPGDVRAEQFFAAMIDRVLAATPVTFHVEVRQQREQRLIPVDEAEASLEQ